ncbi:MAG: hypothetical protein WKF30_01525 [Pyrinomonadaceae bacterium]
MDNVEENVRPDGAFGMRRLRSGWMLVEGANRTSRKVIKLKPVNSLADVIQLLRDERSTAAFYDDFGIVINELHGSLVYRAVALRMFEIVRKTQIDSDLFHSRRICYVAFRHLSLNSYCKPYR